MLFFAVAVVPALAIAGPRPSETSVATGAVGPDEAAAGGGSTAKTTLAATSSSSLHNVTSVYGKLPLSFETNQGQTDPAVQFISRGDGYALFLKKNEAVLALYKTGGHKQKSRQLRRLHRNLREHGAAGEAELIHITTAGANPKASVEPMEVLPGKSNYFVGSDPKKWVAGAPTYKRIKYSGVYPGVDLVYYGNRRQLEFDYVVAPKADPGSIRLHVDTRGHLSIGDDGSLNVEAPNGKFTVQRPDIYQMVNGEKRPVSGGFLKRSSNELGIRVGTYDRTLPLIIDPVLAYSTYLGGDDDDDIQGIAVDSEGNAYVVGSATSLNFPTLNGYTSTANANGVVFLSKLNPAGTALLYSTCLACIIHEGGEIGGLCGSFAAKMLEASVT